MSSSNATNRRNTINPMPIESTLSRKRPAGPMPLDNNNIKRTQPTRLSLGIDRLQLNHEAIGPQRTIIDDSANEPPTSARSMPRPSVFGLQAARRASSFVRPTTGIIQDKILQKFNSPEIAPRRVATDMSKMRDLDTQRKHLNAVRDYLARSGYSGVPPPRNIRALGAKDFQSMFKFLVERIMPHHTFRKKFEDEVMDIIRELQYPLLDSISPKALLAVGALHSNPAFFALLYWLMRCCRTKDKLIELQQEEKDMLLPDAIDSGKLFQDYSIHSYQDYLAGNLHPGSQREVLESSFEKVGEHTKAKRDRLSEKAQRLQGEYDQLIEHEPLVESLQNRLEELSSDKSKFIKAGEDKKARIAKYIDQNARVQREIDRMKGTREQMDARRAIIVDKWRARGTSLEEIEAVDALHRGVTQELSEQSAKLEELKQSISEMEVKISKSKLEIESLILEYNNKISVIPNSENMRITYNENGNDLVSILNVDIENDIIPKLEKFDAELKKENFAITEKTLKLRELLYDLKTKVGDETFKLRTDKERIASLTHDYHEARLRAQDENKDYNIVKDNNENNREERRKRAHQSSLSAKSYVAEREAVLKNVTEAIKTENEHEKNKLENAKNELIASLKNMGLTVDNFKSEVHRINDKYHVKKQ